MRNARLLRALFTLVFILVPLLPAAADDVTISGAVSFAALDGSSLDHDGTANGVFTVNDGDLSIFGTIQCNDVITTDACAMAFAASGSIVLQPGAALYAENRTGGGSGGNISLDAGNAVIVSGASATHPGAIISSGNEDTAASSAGGAISIHAGTTALLGSGSIVSAAAKGGPAGSITVLSEDAINAAGLIAAGPSSQLTANPYSLAILSGGASTHGGGNITLLSHSHSEPAIAVASTATIVSQGGSGTAGIVVLEGCGINVNGLVASLSQSGTNAKVIVRSGTSIVIDARDLGSAGTRAGMMRADALQQSAAGYSVNLFARESIAVHGPATGSLYALNSNGGTTSKDASGTINVMSTASTVTASGNVAAATNGDSGDQGGNVNVSAMFDVTLDAAKLDASGDQSTNNPDRAGGTIDVRSYSGRLSWQNGSGDVRPAGSDSGIASSRQGVIRLTYCTTIATAGTTFATNGAAVAAFPTITQSCSPEAPALPAGETHPDCNDPALAADDAYSVDEGGTLAVAAPGVLANDVDPDGDALTATLVSGPANASSFTFNPDGSFEYVHDGGETTSDSFTYVANDGSLDSNPATVHITITPVNDAPLATDDSYEVDEGGTINYGAPGVLSNDTDSDGPAMTAVLEAGPSHATSFTLNADGSFVYVHDGSETTSDSFTYHANDGSLDSNIATASITIAPVNDAPVANDDTASVDEGGSLNGTSILTNDTDAENDALTASLVSGPANAASFSLNADGTFTYVHDGGETTTDSFTYQANDGVATSNTATVTIAIGAVNDAPVANDDSASVDEGGSLNGTSVLANDTDPENDTLTASLVTGPANAASFTLNPDGTFSYVHDGSETTSDSFTYVANDGAADSNTATVSITINPVNEAPSATDDAYSVLFHGTLNIAAPGVLGNDSDPEGTTLSATLVSGPANGTLALNADGSFSYVHTGTTVGNDSFTYTAGDGSAESNVATVTISIVNEPPSAAADSYLAIGNTELRVGTGIGLNPAAVVSGSVLANDSDADGGPAALSITGYDATSAAGGSVAMNPDGTFNYLPPVGYSGADSFGYTVSDSQATATGVVTINVAERVWYVNPAASGAQSGRSNDPFLTLGQAQGASAASDFIHVAAGAQATGILLKNGQRLIGAGVPLVVGPYTLAGQTARPTLGSTVILASGNVAAGLNVGGIGVGVSASGVSGGTIAEIGVTAAGDGIALSSSSGTFSISDVTLTPGGRGLVITGGSAAVSASNLDIVTNGWSGLAGSAGSLGISAGADGSTVVTTGAAAVDLSNMTLAVSLRSVSANGSANGIALNNTTGSFDVTGNGTAGSGGTIQNTSARGANLLHAGSIALSHMNFTNSAGTNGSVASVCGDTFNGTNLGCNAAIHLVGPTSVVLDDVNVAGSAQIGINGNDVANVTMSGVSVTNAGNEPLEHGVQFVNLKGTNTVANSSFTNNFYRQFTVQNSTGTMSLSVDGSNISSNGLPSGAQGMLVSGHGTADLTVNVQTSTFANNFGAGYFSDGGDSAVLNVTVANSAFTNNNVGTNLAVAGGASLTYEVSGNNISGGTGPGINVFKGSLSTGTVSGKVIGNTVGTAGVPNSACGSSPCEAIGLSAGGSGDYTALVSNNVVRNFRTRAIGASMSEAVVANLAITANDIGEPAVGVSNAIFMQSGSLSTHTTSVCGDIQSNLISGTYAASGAILVRNRFPTTTFRLPGYTGPGNSTSDVAAFLSAQNGGVTAVATINGNIFGGGSACVAP